MKIDRNKLEKLTKEQLIEILNIFLDEDENDSYSMYEPKSNYIYALKKIDSFIKEGK